MNSCPTVTFLFIDFEGNTRLARDHLDAHPVLLAMREIRCTDITLYSMDKKGASRQACPAEIYKTKKTRLSF